MLNQTRPTRQSTPQQISRQTDGSPQASRGSALLQWCIAALPLLLLGSMAIELSHWHTTRQRLALAVQRAVDDTALTGGSTALLKQHLQRHLPDDLRVPIKACIADRVDDLMADFRDKQLSMKLGKPVIRHDHVAEQHREALARGRPNGRGPRSKKTIFEANQLNVHATIRYRALSPWIRQLVDPVTIRLEHQAIMQSHRQRLNTACVELN